MRSSGNFTGLFNSSSPRAHSTKRFVLRLSFALAFAASAASASSPLPSGLTGTETADLNHLSEGSEVFPYEWLTKLKTQDMKPFIENLDVKYGLIRTKQSPSYLLNWQGLAAAWTSQPPLEADAKATDAHVPLRYNGNKPSIKLVGVNCAACHSGALEWNGKTYLIPGAPNMFNPAGFLTDTTRLLTTTVAQKDKLVAFLNAFDVANAEQEAETLSNTFNRNFSQQTGLAPSALMTSEDLGTIAKGRQAIVDAFSKLLKLTYKIGDNADMLELTLKMGSLVDLGFPMAPKRTPEGFGRLDAFGRLRNLGMRAAGVPLLDNTSPLSMPPLWGIRYMSMLNYEANMNSVVLRNIGQALPSGGAVLSKEGDSTLNLHNFDRVEKLFYKVAPAEWERVFADRPELEIDRNLAERGRQIYKQECMSCHTAQQRVGPSQMLYDYTVFPLNAIGTDPNAAKTASALIAPGVRFDDNGSAFSAFLAKRYYEVNKIDAAIQEDWEQKAIHGNDFYRDTLLGWDKQDTVGNNYGNIQPGMGYKARHLSGIWATVPFLHNGSVPTLMDLLTRDTRRPRLFLLKSRKFDPKKVGLQVARKTNCSSAEIRTGECFNSSLPGNSNLGHNYGVELTHADKLAVIEYLKVLEPEPEYGWAQ